MSRLRLATAAAALVGCLSALGEAGDAPEALRLATSAELKDSGLVESLLGRFGKETGIEVRLVGAAERADLQLLPSVAEKEPAKAPKPDRGVREVFRSTLLFLGPPAGDKRSYGESNYRSWGRPKSPLGNPSAYITRSSASQLLKEINLSGHPIAVCRRPGWIRERVRKLMGTEDPRRSCLETGEPIARTLEIASVRSAYAIADAATYLRLRRKLRLDVVLARDDEFHVSYRAKLTETGSSKAARRLYDWFTSDQCGEVVRHFLLDGERPYHLPSEQRSTTLRGRLDPTPVPDEDR